MQVQTYFFVPEFSVYAFSDRLIAGDIKVSVAVENRHLVVAVRKVVQLGT